MRTRNIVIAVVLCMAALLPIGWHYANMAPREEARDSDAPASCEATVFAPHNRSLCEILEAVGDQKKNARRLASNQYDLFVSISFSALILTTLATFLLGFTGEVWHTAARACTALAAIGTGLAGVWGLPNWTNVNGQLQWELAALESELELSVQLADEAQTGMINLDGKELSTKDFVTAAHGKLSSLLAKANEQPWVAKSSD